MEPLLKQRIADTARVMLGECDEKITDTTQRFLSVFSREYEEKLRTLYLRKVALTKFDTAFRQSNPSPRSLEEWYCGDFLLLKHGERGLVRLQQNQQVLLEIILRILSDDNEKHSRKDVTCPS